MSKFLSALFASFLLLGCADSTYFEPVISGKTPQGSNASEVIARDFISFIAPYYPTAKTTFLVSQRDENNVFSQTIESSLRKAGYGVTFDKNDALAVRLAWKVSFLNSKAVVQFNVANANILRAYVINEKTSALEPNGPFSARGLPQPVYKSLNPPLDDGFSKGLK